MKTSFINYSRKALLTYQCVFFACTSAISFEIPLLLFLNLLTNDFFCAPSLCHKILFLLIWFPLVKSSRPLGFRYHNALPVQILLLWLIILFLHLGKHDQLPCQTLFSGILYKNACLPLYILHFYNFYNCLR